MVFKSAVILVQNWPLDNNSFFLLMLKEEHVMKKTINLILVTVLIVVMTGCGKSEGVIRVENKIQEIGEVSLDSIDAIDAAEVSYHVLKDNEKNAVGNLSILTQAREEYDRIYETAALDYYKKFADQYSFTIQHVQEDYSPYTFSTDFIYSEDFSNLSAQEQFVALKSLKEDPFNVHGQGKLWCLVRIVSGDKEYAVSLQELRKITVNDGRKSEEILYSEAGNNSSYSSTKTKTKCPTCNGSGLIRYYYGGSSLEALLDGQPDSTVQKCYTCDGSGYIYK